MAFHTFSTPYWGGPSGEVLLSDPLEEDQHERLQAALYERDSERRANDDPPLYYGVPLNITCRWKDMMAQCTVGTA